MVTTMTEQEEGTHFSEELIPPEYQIKSFRGLYPFFFCYGFYSTGGMNEKMMGRLVHR